MHLLSSRLIEIHVHITFLLDLVELQNGDFLAMCSWGVAFGISLHPFLALSALLINFVARLKLLCALYFVEQWGSFLSNNIRYLKIINLILKVILFRRFHSIFFLQLFSECLFHSVLLSFICLFVQGQNSCPSNSLECLSVGFYLQAYSASKITVRLLSAIYFVFRNKIRKRRIFQKTKLRSYKWNNCIMESFSEEK